MPIQAADIIARVRRVGLDAQPNTDYYDDNIDIIPAIDSAVKWLVSVINAARSQNKATDEAVRELAKVYIYRTSEQSRIIFEDSIWTIDSVAPLCTTIENGLAPLPVPTSPFQSWKRNNLSFVRSYYSCFRKTIEEHNANRLNPMSPGFMPESLSQSQLTEGSKYNISFCYIPSYDYNYINVAKGSYIEILPEIPYKNCAIFCIEQPSAVISANDTIRFPQSLFNILYEKTLQFISYSQGDGTSIWSVTENDISKLFKAIV